MSVKYVIARMVVVRCANLENRTQEEVEYIPDERFGVFNSTKEAKVHFVKNHWLPALKNCTNINYIVKHFNAQERNLKHYKVVKIKE